jgi:hypothetical protein
MNSSSLPAEAAFGQAMGLMRLSRSCNAVMWRSSFVQAHEVGAVTAPAQNLNPLTTSL